MYDRMQHFTSQELNKIHNASMDILENIGIIFDDDEALEIFKKGGLKVDGKTVFISEKAVKKALETAPYHFSLTARNPEKSVAIGGDDFALAPGYGASFIVTETGKQRIATISDYTDFCKLVHTSKLINVNGFLMVMPSDVPSETAHLDMLYSNIVFSDKPFMGSPISRAAAIDCINMAAIIRDGKKELQKAPLTISLITPLSPLRYTAEMAGSIIEIARHNQACIFGALIMAGSSGPIAPAGLLAQQTAEILAGVALTQMVRPGAPVVAGGASAIMDMRTGCLSMGAPEVARFASATAQIAKFYNLPARCGCSVTDAHFPDAQAGFESALNFITAYRNGSNFILHSAGILGAYSSMSFEKFIIDEEICSVVIESLEPIEITEETIDLDVIKEVGNAGNYLTHPNTFEQCRTAFFLSSLVNRKSYNGWQNDGAKHIDTKASEVLNQRLSSYVKPDIDPQIEKELSAYVLKRKNKVIRMPSP